MAGFLVRRLLFAAGTVLLTAFFAYGVIRLLRPERTPGEPVLAGTWDDVEREFLHLGMGGPDIKELWIEGYWADLFLLTGGVVVAVTAGVLGGLWCAAHHRTRSGRAVEGVALFLLCAPVYAIGLGTLLLFAPPFGVLEVPVFFEPNSYAPPLESPWDFVRSMILPCLVVGAPLGAAICASRRRWPSTRWGRTMCARRPRRGSRTRRSCAATRGRRPTCRSPRCSAPRPRS